MDTNQVPTMDFPCLSAAHRPRIRRLNAEVARLARWDAFVRAYHAACEATPHGQRTALRLRLGAEMGLDDRETAKALWGR